MIFFLFLSLSPSLFFFHERKSKTDDIEINKAFVIRRLKQIAGGGERVWKCTQASPCLLRKGSEIECMSCPPPQPASPKLLGGGVTVKSNGKGGSPLLGAN